MMKLKYLFDNPALAEMLLSHWEYDAASLELFQYYRISSNAIYPFKQNGQICFLRFSPLTEKRQGAIAAELEFIHYLRSQQYPALEPLPTKTGELIVQQATPWGETVACVFKRVKGKQVSDLNYDDKNMFAYGDALGKLHRLSSGYITPNTKRWTHGEVLDWIEETLLALQVDGAPLAELALLREYFSSLPVNPQNYGLIHYDFEPDNLFHDEETGICSVIDFDDAMYHWYVMDIVQALRSLKREIPESDFPEKTAVFLLGYKSQFAIDEGLLAAMPLFRRFADIYQYARISRAVQEQWENEPEWLAGLRVKLSGMLARNAQHFGKAMALKGTSFNDQRDEL